MMLLSFMGLVLALTGFILVIALQVKRQPPQREDLSPRECGCHTGCGEHLYEIREPKTRLD